MPAKSSPSVPCILASSARAGRRSACLLACCRHLARTDLSSQTPKASTDERRRLRTRRGWTKGISERVNKLTHHGGWSSISLYPLPTRDCVIVSAVCSGPSVVVTLILNLLSYFISIRVFRMFVGIKSFSDPSDPSTVYRRPPARRVLLTVTSSSSASSHHPSGQPLDDRGRRF